ncbi:MAG: hypothetical protein OQK12_00240 [Motiliproteus sp.]|nr:hypothetical protein [Motiliproteus sp.]MCW9051083.1 hypothetical protein [Motiliproteus sp.]
MKFELSEEVMRQARSPHELFLTNMVGNHILWFVASLGILNTYWQPMLLVPIVSVSTILYTLWRAKKSAQEDHWFVMCHWQVAAKRSKIFACIMLAGLVIGCLGWVGYTYLGMMKVAVQAMVGGIGLLPVMVSVLVLIVMESDGMHQASSGKMSKGVFAEYPNDEVVILEDSRLEEPEQGVDTKADNQQAS